MKDDVIYIDHILLSVKNILKYTKDITKEEFSRSSLIQDAVIRNFEIIGEATRKVSPGFKKNNPDVPWKEMAGMRDKLIHDYIGVDTQVIWDTIKMDLPVLRKKLKKI